MQDINEAATAMLDVRGIHPGNNDWYRAFETFRQVASQQRSFSNGIDAALKLLKVRNKRLRIKAAWTFWSTLQAWSIVVWILAGLLAGMIISGILGNLLRPITPDWMGIMGSLFFLAGCIISVGVACLGFRIGDRLATRHLERE